MEFLKEPHHVLLALIHSNNAERMPKRKHSDLALCPPIKSLSSRLYTWNQYGEVQAIHLGLQ